MIDIDFSFFVQIVNFGILVLIMHLALYKPIRAILAQRRQEIDSARELALAVDQKVQDKVSEYENRLRDARSEVGARRAELVKEAQAEEASLIEKARSEAVASLASLRTRVAAESNEAREMLKKQAEVISGDICEKILGRSL